MTRMTIAMPLVALLAACGSNSGGGGSAATQIKAVGSSTVYPFTRAVAEQFQQANPGTSVIVESTGTGAGLKLFCGGVGNEFPDVANASRQISMTKRISFAPSLRSTRRTLAPHCTK